MNAFRILLYQSYHSRDARESFLLQSSIVETKATTLQASTRKDGDVGGLCVCSRTGAANVKLTHVNNINSQKEEEGEEEEETQESRLRQSSHFQVQEDANDLHALMASLKACIKQRDLQKGSQIHAIIASRQILQNDIFLANTIITLYAKCGALAKAHEICVKLRFRNVVSWNILIAGYADYGPGEEALRCFNFMQLEGISPSAATFTSLLKACVGIGAEDKVHELHAHIEREGFLKKDVVVGTTLVDALAKLGSLTKAREVFDKLPVHDVISWNTLITGYAQDCQGEEALYCLERMRDQGFYPNDVTFIGSLKACVVIRATRTGQEIHAEIVECGLDGSHNVVNAVIDMYAKFGLLAEARAVFEKLPIRDVISFGGLIAGYAQHGCGEEALLCFRRMQSESVSPNIVTVVSVLKVCGSMEAVDEGFQIHSRIVKEGVLDKDVVVGRALLDMYGNYGFLEAAQEVFDRLSHRDVHSFNLLISAYSKNGCDELALTCFERMQAEGLSPNSITLSCILKVCTNLGATDKGQQIHEQVIMCHSLSKDLAVVTTLLDMYASRGLLTKAREVFDTLPVHDVALWNSLIGGYTQHGHGEQAMYCFQEMKSEGLVPDAITYACVLKACSATQAVHEGLEVHTEIETMGFLEDDPMVGTALVDMYAKCGRFVEAQKVFDGLPNTDIVSWNALISEYAKSGRNEEALMCFEQMQLAGLHGNTYTFSSALKSCASIGSIYTGQDMHAKAVREGLLKEELIVPNTLVDMYCNFGMLARAQEVFDSLVVKDVVSWNALIKGYCQLGKEKVVFEILDKMLAEGIDLDVVTFAIVLNMCSHTGLLEKGQVFFETLTTRFDINATIEHYTCIIDMFGRAGHVDKVVPLIKETPFFANATLWLVVLGACQKWGETDLGKLAFRYAAQSGKKDAAAYVSLGNLF